MARGHRGSAGPLLSGQLLLLLRMLPPWLLRATCCCCCGGRGGFAGCGSVCSRPS